MAAGATTSGPHTHHHHASHAGTDYHFCSARCREKFVADPGRYTAPTAMEEKKGSCCASKATAAISDSRCTASTNARIHYHYGEAIL